MCVYVCREEGRGLKDGELGREELYLELSLEFLMIKLLLTHAT